MYHTPCVSRETVYNNGYGNEPLLQLNLLLCYCIDPLILAILFRDKPSVISIMSRGVLLQLWDCEYSYAISCLLDVKQISINVPVYQSELDIGFHDI